MHTDRGGTVAAETAWLPAVSTSAAATAIRVHLCESVLKTSLSSATRTGAA
jgi:hypothetical protein